MKMQKPTSPEEWQGAHHLAPLARISDGLKVKQEMGNIWWDRHNKCLGRDQFTLLVSGGISQTKNLVSDGTDWLQKRSIFFSLLLYAP